MSIDGLAPGQSNPYVAAARQDAARERVRADSQSAQRAPPREEPQQKAEPKTARVRELRV